MKAQPDPEPTLVMKNHLALNIRVEQFILLINTACREHLQVQAFCSQKLVCQTCAALVTELPFSCFE